MTFEHQTSCKARLAKHQLSTIRVGLRQRGFVCLLLWRRCGTASYHPCALSWITFQSSSHVGVTSGQNSPWTVTFSFSSVHANVPPSCEIITGVRGESEQNYEDKSSYRSRTSIAWITWACETVGLPPISLASDATMLMNSALPSA